VPIIGKGGIDDYPYQRKNWHRLCNTNAMMANNIFHNRWGLVGLILLTLALIGAGGYPAHAMMTANNAGAIRDCSPLMRMAEVQYGIPDRLLQAIAYAESGRTDPKNRRRVAWPWTINAEGDGFVFDSKAAAISQVRALRQQGVESIDVGCMQVNLIHHADAFDSLEQAFEPVHNIDYAARFLKSLQQETGSWAQAVAFYHSRNQNISDGYRQKVLSLWQKTRPDGVVAAQNKRQNNPMPAVLAATTPTASQTTAAFPATINKMANARYRTVPASNQGMGVSNPRLAMGSRVDAPRPINARYRLAMGTIPPNQMQAGSSLQGQVEGQAPAQEVAQAVGEVNSVSNTGANSPATGIALPARGFPLPLRRVGVNPIPLSAVAQNTR
jgi:hypothetical protein